MISRKLLLAHAQGTRLWRLPRDLRWYIARSQPRKVSIFKKDNGGGFTDKTQYYSIFVAGKNSFGAEVSSNYADLVYSLATN